MRLIDADTLLKHSGIFEVKARARGCGNSILNLAKAWLWNEVNIAPTIDAVPVVRCEKCIAYTPVDDNTGKCVFLIGEHQYVVPDGYCYLGERKEGADNG